MVNQSKRLILCCDGTWMDSYVTSPLQLLCIFIVTSDDGFSKPTLIPYVPTGTLQVPSNVTRISRSLRRTGLDGKHQIVYYHSGVGTSSSWIDVLTGGLLGTGISEHIREIYSFVAANYMPGDEIILIGFSRGAFTARSVAGMIRDIGLLTRKGMDQFYPIFKDQENFRTNNYHDIFPTTPFPNKPRGPDAAREYKRRLEDNGLTRAYDPDGTRIHVHAVAVWDTVGSLGIPNTAFLAKLGLPHSTKEYKFYDTNLSGTIRHAFQALALDEHRMPFSPAVWERTHMEKDATDLRQVWFPGAHANVGGGYPDQEMANITMAWMMDQLASIGVAFQNEYIETMFKQNVEYYENAPEKPTTLSSIFSRRPWKQWAITPIYENHRPVRPFALGRIDESETSYWLLAGKKIRTPGLYTRADPDTGSPTNIPMTHTNERIHSCVRIRLELEGLGNNDIGLYKCPALLQKGPWRLRQVRLHVEDPISPSASWGPEAPAYQGRRDDMRWVWEYDGPEETAPKVRMMIEETLGPYQRKLLLLNKGRSYYKKYRNRRRRRKSRRQKYEKEEDIESLTNCRKMNNRLVQYIEDLSPKEIELLTQLLSIKSRDPRSLDWLRDQATCLASFPPTLRRPISILPRLAMALSFTDPEAQLCNTHKPLPAQLIHRIFFQVSAECTTHLTRLVENRVLSQELFHFIKRIQSISSLWTSRELYRNLVNAMPEDPCFERVASGCEACILSVVGGDHGILSDLRASMIGRKKKGHPTRPRLLPLVESWINWTGQGDEIRCKSDMLAKTIRRCRRQMQHARRQTRRNIEEGILDPPTGREGQQSSMTSDCEEGLEADRSERYRKQEQEFEESIKDLYASSSTFITNPYTVDSIHAAFRNSVVYSPKTGTFHHLLPAPLRPQCRHSTWYAESAPSRSGFSAVSSRQDGPGLSAEEFAESYRNLIVIEEEANGRKAPERRK
ncbi:hypothetical protein B7494_g3808 [Chlorociboria aeruginascens]|nr:hypothetical protein B7494_g3808 [Chlorociboria aeruginascens]